MSARDIIFSTMSGPSETGWLSLLNKTSTNIVGKSIAVDSLGNIYVALYNPSVLIKYNKDGISQWQQTLTAVNTFTACEIALDSSNNIYLVCTTSSNPSKAVLVKYDSTGTLQWQRYISGVSNTLGYSVTIDINGYIIISGQTTAGSTNGAFIAKYNSSGNLSWNKSISYSTGTTTISNIVIKAYSNTIFLVATINTDYYYIARFDANGGILWQTAKGAFSAAAKPKDLVLDSVGNLYTIGEYGTATHIILKYNNSGVLQWQKQIPTYGNYIKSITCDAQDNLYVITSATTAATYLVYKLNNAGANSSTLQVDIPSITDTAADIAVNNTYIYILGTSSISPNSKVLLAKIPKAGTSTGSYAVGTSTVNYTTASTVTLATTTAPDISFTAIVPKTGNIAFIKPTTASAYPVQSLGVDSSGNIYFGGNNNLYKYDKYGSPVWNVYTQYIKLFTSIIFDSSGNIYVSGLESATSGATTYPIAAKISSVGTVIWLRSYWFSSAQRNFASLKLSSDGSYLYLATGTGYVSSQLLKLNLDSTIVWQRNIAGMGASGLAVDTSNRIYLAGTSNPTGNASKAIIYRIVDNGASGCSVEVASEFSLGHTNNSFNNIAVAPDESVYLTGYGNAGAYGFVIKLYSNVTVAWCKKIDNASTNDIVNCVTTDSSSNVYIAGSYYAGSAKLFINKYLSNGTLSTNLSLTNNQTVNARALYAQGSHILLTMDWGSSLQCGLWKLLNSNFTTGTTYNDGASTYTIGTVTGEEAATATGSAATAPTITTLNYIAQDTLTATASTSATIFGAGTWLEGLPLESSAGSLTTTTDTVAITSTTI